MFEEAIVDLEKCYALFPFFTDAINNLGLACHEMNQLQKALFFYKKALLLDGDAVCLFLFEELSSFSLLSHLILPPHISSLLFHSRVERRSPLTTMACV